MIIEHYRVFAAVSVSVFLAACGGVDTANPSTTGSGGSGTSSSGGTGGGSTGTGPDCTAPQQACGGSCIDTSADVKNCGSCGHDCLGGDCVISRCQPVAIATDQKGVYHFAVNSLGVYWSTDQNKNGLTSPAVMMWAKAGGQVIPLALGLDNPVISLAVDEKNAYWTMMTGVMMVSVGGSGIVKTIATSTTVIASGVAVDATSIYWADDYVAINKIPLGGGNSTQLTTANMNSGVKHLAVDANSLYWWNTAATDQTISKVPILGGAATTLTPGIKAGPFVIDEKYAYWFDAMNQVKAISLGGGPVMSLGTLPYPTAAIAQDKKSLYFSSIDALGAIVRLPKIGGDPEVIASGHGYVSSLVVDDTSVYWSGNDGLVLKVAK